MQRKAKVFYSPTTRMTAVRSLEDNDTAVPTTAKYISPMSHRCKKLFETWTGWSSLHGLAWYTRTSITLFKLFIAFFACTMVIGLCAIIVNEAVVFAHDDTITNSVEWDTAETIDYPNITLCNSKYFQPARLEKYNVSDALASYLLLALDASMQQYIEFMKNLDGENIERKIGRLEKELQATMKEHQFGDILDMFRALAVPCEDFISFCEEHRKFYLSAAFTPLTNSYPNCCEAFFNPNPFFTQVGTCYTSNKVIVETFPSVLSSIKIWVAVDEKDSPNYVCCTGRQPVFFIINILSAFDMHLLGSDATEKTGVKWALSHKEHPARVLAASPEKLDMGTSTMVGLSKVVVDRRELPDKCLSLNATFKEMHNMENTQLNCHLFGMAALTPNCSTGAFSGWRANKSLPLCRPTDILNNKYMTMFSEVESPPFASNDVCPPDCYRESFEVKVATGRVDSNSMRDFIMSFLVPQLNLTGEAAVTYAEDTATQSAMLQLYFSSFVFPTYTLHRMTVMDFLSKVGGWMGLAMGGSVISCLELVALAGFVLWQLFCVKATSTEIKA